MEEFFYNEMGCWQEARLRYEALEFNVQTRELLAESHPGVHLRAQWNPARMVSTGAKVDAVSTAARPCFLCEKNRPEVQHAMPAEDGFCVLVNPFPILPQHFTIVHEQHRPQSVMLAEGTLQRMAWQTPQYLFFYNGPLCGASCPDHMHFQAGSRGIAPIEDEWEKYGKNLLHIRDELYLLKGFACPAFVIRSRAGEWNSALFRALYDTLPLREGELEPRLNMVCWRQQGNEDELITVIFPRAKHRPGCYYAEGESQLLISPGALDMCGLLITPRGEDFARLTFAKAQQLLQEVTMTEEELKPILAALAG